MVRYPIYRLVAKMRHGVKAVSDDTDIIIDGFPRSGNTFAVTAFKYAQPSAVNVSSHIHAPIEVITAVKKGIPAIVLVRDPDDAAMSFMIMLGQNVSAKTAYDYYIRFYESLLPYDGKFVACHFDTTIKDFGSAIRAVNVLNNKDFGVFDHTKENVDKCFDIIDAEYKDWRGEIRELNVSRPSDSRKDIKDELRKTLREPHLAAVRERAYKVYQEFVDMSERLVSSNVA